jgi:hypothetical protein
VRCLSYQLILDTLTGNTHYGLQPIYPNKETVPPEIAFFQVRSTDSS